MRKFMLLQGLLLAFVMFAAPAPSYAQVAVGISVHIGPPPLRIYAQPICPGPDYIWTPGYWAYGDAGYYWVPGAWVLAPEPGLLWTPGYWGFSEGAYVWHRGYWGPHVGFYGGINYGFGYGGVGFAGGEWRHGHFFYNTAVVHVNGRLIRNTYVDRRVVIRNDNHVAFNGEGGIRAFPNREEMAAERDHHFEATHEQLDHRDMAVRDRENRDERADRRDERHDDHADRRDERNAQRDERNAQRDERNAQRNERNAQRDEQRENRNENRQQRENRQPRNDKNNHPDKGDRPHGDHPHR